MRRSQMLQAVLDDIDENITETITASGLAKRAGYSVYHFSRIFAEAAGKKRKRLQTPKIRKPEISENGRPFL